MKSVLLSVIFCISVLQFCFSDEKQGFLFDAYVPFDKETEATIEKAQKWLASNQRADGAWKYDKDTNNGVNALCVLALMVGGSVPGEGKFGKEIALGLQYIINTQKESGLLAPGELESHAPMYQHALSAILLAEAYGMTQNPRIRKSLIEAVNLIVSSQHSRGGWRYLPKPSDGDISATVMQVMALRAASEAGIYVPSETIDRAIKFIKHCYNENEKGFGYMDGRGKAEFPRTAAGLVCLQTVGLGNDKIIPDIIEYIQKNAFVTKHGFYWYGHYYASIGMYHYGGEPWKTYYPKIKNEIMSNWGGNNPRYDNFLHTAWQILILGVPYRYLPIYQR
ncbi:MAG TPA: terpene cyclase/mutase family protein [Victivallales bacterium]|nr:terpene cyclase/mutase family protein [Victivallales bacterium]HPO89793.1 terpene cyclase/mutase family protein [Victivallales bacterium]HRR27972.1 terpene cyclase/mutase family protein [Victivallales bacterium]HRU01098.1 terpene cyclase/mutase family protein [Victivallales bacterium]